MDTAQSNKKIKTTENTLLSRLLPFLYIFCIWFVFSAPYFFQHQVPYPSKYQVNFFHPWSDYKEFNGPYKNGAMPDVIDEIMPWKHFTIETYKKGQIPFWNPNSFAGTPHLANIQSAVLSPFNLLFFVLPFVDAWSIMILLQPLLAAIFTYLLLRELKVSRLGSVVSAVTYMFSGFIVVWMAYGTLAMAILFLPLALFAIEKAYNKLSFLPLLLLTMSIPLSFFSGHFQISLYFLVYCFAYFLFKFFVTKNKKTSLLLAVCLLAGLLISLLQIIPALGLYAQAARSNIYSNNGAIPFQYLVTLFAPDFYGNPVTRNDWFGYYAEWSSFIGIIPFLLALFSISTLFTKAKKEKKNSAIIFFIAAAVITLILSLDTPLQQMLVQLKLPILSTSIPSRIITLCSFSLAVLAGFGIDALRKYIEDHSLKRILVVLGVTGFIILASATALFIMPPDKMKIAIRNIVLPVLIFIIAAAIIIFPAWSKNKKIIGAVLLSLLLLISFDSYRFAAKWMPFDPREDVFPEMPVITAMKKNVGTGRVFGNMGAFVDTYYELPAVDGYDPLYIARYGEFINAAINGKYAGVGKSLVSLEKQGKYVNRVLDLLGVSIIFHPRPDTFQSWAFPVWADGKRYKEIYQDEKFQLYRNTAALPRAKVFYDYEVIADGKQLLERFYQEEFDFRKTLLLETDPGFQKCKIACGEGKANITYYSPNKVLIFVETQRPALLFLSDTFYPQWKVKVNGSEKEIYRTDYAFRSVFVPAGKSTVEFYYSGLF